MRYACAFVLLALCGCASTSSSNSGGKEEVEIATSDKARDIVGLSLQLDQLQDRRESEGQRAWSFRLTNHEPGTVALRITPLYVGAGGKSLGGASESKLTRIPTGQSENFYFKAPTGEVVRLLVTFERE